MSRNPSWKRDLKKLANEPAGLIEVLFNPQYIKDSDDRVAAIMAATDVEDELTTYLMTKMISLSGDERNELFGAMGPLGTHGSRIKLSYALGLFGKRTFEDLETIRLIRNVFAHSRKAIWFDTPEVKIGCMHLTIISRTKNFGSISVERDPTTPRDQYLSSCRLLYFGISKMANPLVYEDKYFDIPLD